MKNITLIFLLAISCSTFSQTIRRCNNNPGVTGLNVYTTLQAAHDAAVAGDIIYIEPSTADYGSLDSRKRLTIIGNGYFLDKNANNAFDTRSSKVLNVTFNNGSANSILTGIDSYPSVININDINITITRCRNSGPIFGTSANLVAGINSRGNNGTITKCFIYGYISGSNSTNITSQTGYNIVVSNCIFNYGGVGTLTNSVVSNNIYFPASNSSMRNLFGCSVTNNILDARGSTVSQVFVNNQSVGNTISNNICLGQVATPSGNGNVNLGDVTNTFLVPNPWSNALTEDSKFQLIAGSPAIGIGTGGTNTGAFGGSNPYILSGMPSYPVITNFLPSGVGNISTPLQVNITVRGNN